MDKDVKFPNKVRGEPMLESTKSMIVSGLLVALVTGISTIIYTKSGTLDKHEVRITHLERGATQAGSTVKTLASEVGSLRVETATVVTMLSSLNQTNLQLSKTTIELGKIVARLDERSKPNPK